MTAPNAATLNVNETFTVDIVRGDRRTGTHAQITNVATGNNVFAKPSDNIGTRTSPTTRRCGAARYTVKIRDARQRQGLRGQRKDPCAVNLGVIFDLINIPGAADFTPAEAAFVLDTTKKDVGADSLAFKNVTSLAVEVPASCLLAAGSTDTVIGGWTTASLRQGQLLSNAPKSGYGTSAIAGGAWTQVSRLGMPLVTSVVIGLPTRTSSTTRSRERRPVRDYVTNRPCRRCRDRSGDSEHRAEELPRTDLVTTFSPASPRQPPKPFTTTPSTGVLSEMLRLNTAIAPVPYASQTVSACSAGCWLVAPTSRAIRRQTSQRRRRRHLARRRDGRLCVATGAADTYKLGTTCNPTNSRSARGLQPPLRRRPAGRR